MSAWVGLWKATVKPQTFSQALLSACRPPLRGPPLGDPRPGCGDCGGGPFREFRERFEMRGAWHGTARHGTPRHGTARHGTTGHDTTRHDTTRHDTTRHDMSSMLCYNLLSRRQHPMASCYIACSCMFCLTRRPGPRRRPGRRRRPAATPPPRPGRPGSPPSGSYVGARGDPNYAHQTSGMFVKLLGSSVDHWIALLWSIEPSMMFAAAASGKAGDRSRVLQTIRTASGKGYVRW